MCDCLLVLAALGVVWSLFVWRSSGIDVSLGALEFSSHDVWRPVLLTLLMVTAFTLLGGWREVAPARAAFRAASLAAVMGAALMAMGIADRTGVASGADSYGYLSEAELWRAGSLKVEQPFVRDLPWPNRAWTATPLGYRPSDESNVGTLVPQYAPGLPFLMAVAKSIAGQAAMFWIVPFFGAVLVVATYGLGARIGSPAVGLAAAFLVALSPAVLFMVVWPMTDVPESACWALATWAALGASRKRALAGGLCAALAIFIRPNLVWVGGLIGLWLIARDLSERPRRLDRAALFALGALPAVVAVMWLNQSLFGSPFRSGYGRFSDFLRLSRFGVNVRHYGSALSWSETPLVWLGLIPLALPLRRIWRERARARDAAILTLVAAGTLACYLFYLSFEEWWYLRFLLPLWPGLFIGLAWMLHRLGRERMTWWAAVIVLALGGYGLWFAEARGFQGLKETERRYVVAAHLVRDQTPPNSVIFSMQHSGSVRYYGERMTLRYDTLPPEWLDRSVAWLAAHGAHPYVLLDSWELDAFRRRFSGGSALGRLEVGTVFELEQPGHVFLFDLLSPPSDAWPRVRRPPMGAADRTAPMGARPSLVF